jgi:hypothetical protein
MATRAGIEAKGQMSMDQARRLEHKIFPHGGIEQQEGNLSTLNPTGWANILG